MLLEQGCEIKCGLGTKYNCMQGLNLREPQCTHLTQSLQVWAALGRGHDLDFGLKWAELRLTSKQQPETFSPDKASGQHIACFLHHLKFLFVISHSSPPSKCLLSKYMTSIWPLSPTSSAPTSFIPSVLLIHSHALQLVSDFHVLQLVSDFQPCSFPLLKFKLILPNKAK